MTQRRSPYFLREQIILWCARLGPLTPFQLQRVIPANRWQTGNAIEALQSRGLVTAIPTMLDRDRLPVIGDHLWSGLARSRMVRLTPLGRAHATTYDLRPPIAANGPTISLRRLVVADTITHVLGAAHRRFRWVGWGRAGWLAGQALVVIRESTLPPPSHVRWCFPQPMPNARTMGLAITQVPTQVGTWQADLVRHATRWHQPIRCTQTDVVLHPLLVVPDTASAEALAAQWLTHTDQPCWTTYGSRWREAPMTAPILQHTRRGVEMTTIQQTLDLADAVVADADHGVRRAGGGREPVDWRTCAGW